MISPHIHISPSFACRPPGRGGLPATLAQTGHIHTDRSRERRVNSARSDDSSYPKIKTPSRDDTLICSPTFDNEPDLKAGLMTTEPLSYDHSVINHHLKTHYSPPPGHHTKIFSRRIVPGNPGGNLGTWSLQNGRSEEVHLSEDQHRHTRSRSPAAANTELIFSETDRSSVEHHHHNRDHHRSTLEHHPRSSATDHAHHHHRRRSQKVVELQEPDQIPVKRSISITLPNQLSHKLRKRIHTTNDTSESTAAPEFRVRLSKPRNRRSSDQVPDSQMDQDARMRERSARHRRKHYSEFYPAESDSKKIQSQRATLTDLLSHFNEIEVRNKVKMQQRNARITRTIPPNLPEDSANMSLLKFVERSQEEARSTPPGSAEPRRKNYMVTQVKEQGSSRRGRKKSEYSTMEEQFSQMKIEARFNSGAPDNICSRTDPPTTVQLSDSESASGAMVTESTFTKQPSPEKPARSSRKNHLRHYVEYTKVSTKGGQNFIQPGKVRRVNTVQKVEVVPRGTPEKEVPKIRKVIPDVVRKTPERDQVRKTLETRKTPERRMEQSPSHSSTPETGKKTAVRRTRDPPAGTTERVVKVVERSKTSDQRVARKSASTTTSRRGNPSTGETRTNDQNLKTKPSRPTQELPSEPSPRAVIKSALKKPRPAEPAIELSSDTGASEEEEVNSEGNNIIRMLKKIDKQTLKRRLSLDKLADLDSDDESHLDKMLSEITAFVEGKIKRRRVKTGCPPGIRFGPSTVHVYDPLSHLDKMLSEITAFVEGKIKRRRVKTGCPPGIRFGPSTVHVYDPLAKLELLSAPNRDSQQKIPESILKVACTAAVATTAVVGSAAAKLQKRKQELLAKQAQHQGGHMKSVKKSGSAPAGIGQHPAIVPQMGAKSSQSGAKSSASEKAPTTAVATVTPAGASTADQSGSNSPLKKYPTAEATKTGWNRLQEAILMDKDKVYVRDPEEEESTPGLFQKESVISSEPDRKLPPKLYDLVNRLSQSKDMMARIKTQAPKERCTDLEQSLQYGKHRKGLSKLPKILSPSLSQSDMIPTARITKFLLAVLLVAVSQSFPAGNIGNPSPSLSAGSTLGVLGGTDPSAKVTSSGGKVLSSKLPTPGHHDQTTKCYNAIANWIQGRSGCDRCSFTGRCRQSYDIVQLVEKSDMIPTARITKFLLAVLLVAVSQSFPAGNIGNPSPSLSAGSTLGVLGGGDPKVTSSGGGKVKSSKLPTPGHHDQTTKCYNAIANWIQGRSGCDRCSFTGRCRQSYDIVQLVENVLATTDCGKKGSTNHINRAQACYDMKAQCKFQTEAHWEADFNFMWHQLPKSSWAEPHWLVFLEPELQMKRNTWM
eukprot:sb/3461037/